VPFVGAAGLVGPEHAHSRGASIPSRPYKKIEPLLQIFSIVVSRNKLTEATVLQNPSLEIHFHGWFLKIAACIKH